MANRIGITLDPGHAANYNRGVVSSYYESNTMYNLSLLLKNELDKYGIFTVHNTKPKLDCNPTLAARAKVAINAKDRFLISLHSNAVTSSSVHDTIVFMSVKRPGTREFAVSLSDTIAAVLHADNGVTKSRAPQASKNSAGGDYYGVIRNAVLDKCIQGAFIIEHAFHTNVAECTSLNKPSIIEALAIAEAKCIYNNLKHLYIGDNVKVYTGKVTAGINVRPKPATDSTSTPIGSLSSGNSVKIVSKTGNWYKILFNGCAAFVSRDYVTCNDNVPDDSAVNFGLPGEPADIPDPEPNDKPVDLVFKYQINTSKTFPMSVDTEVLNIRSEPDVKYSKIGSLNRNTVVYTYEGKNIPDNWVAFKCSIKDHSIAFVCKDYLKSMGNVFTKAVVNCSALRIREQPSTKAAIFKTLNRGSVVYIVNKMACTTDSYEWAEIILDENDLQNHYYAANLYLTDISDNIPWSNCDFGKTTASSLNVRSAPNINASKIGSLPRNTFVVVTDEIDDGSRIWCKITFKEGIGYISKEYVSLFTEPDPATIINAVPEKFKEKANAIQQYPNPIEWFEDTMGVHVTSNYGNRTHPITGVVQSYHAGVDMGGVPAGTQIPCDVSGIVCQNYYSSSYGNLVVVLAEDGTEHYFAHMQEPGFPKVGEFVVPGTVIGKVGSTGNSTGPHLHYEVRKSLYVYKTNNISPFDYTFQ